MRIILQSGNRTLAEFDHIRPEAMPKVVRYLGEIFAISHPLTVFHQPTASYPAGHREIVGFHFQLAAVQDLRAVDAIGNNRHFA